MDSLLAPIHPPQSTDTSLFFKSLNDLRRSRQLLDFGLLTRDSSGRVVARHCLHKVVLLASSPFLLRLYSTDSLDDDDLILPPSIRDESLVLLIDHMYGQTDDSALRLLSDEDATYLRTAARFFGIEGLRKMLAERLGAEEEEEGDVMFNKQFVESFGSDVESVKKEVNFDVYTPVSSGSVASVSRASAVTTIASAISTSPAVTSNASTSDRRRRGPKIIPPAADNKVYEMIYDDWKLNSENLKMSQEDFNMSNENLKISDGERKMSDENLQLSDEELNTNVDVADKRFTRLHKKKQKEKEKELNRKSLDFIDDSPEEEYSHEVDDLSDSDYDADADPDAMEDALDSNARADEAIKKLDEERVRRKKTKDKDRFRCPHCPYRSNAKNSYQKHVWSNHKVNLSGRKILYCDQCDFSTICGSSLRKHSFKHVLVPTITCSQCGKAFKSHYQLKEHTRYVHGKKTLACSICKSGFVNAIKLRIHVKQVHIEKSTERNFKCAYCEYATFTRSNCFSHLKRIHQGEKRIVVDLRKCEEGAEGEGKVNEGGHVEGDAPKNGDSVT